MTDTIEKAINKIDGEAEKIGDDYVKLVASHLIEQITTEDAAQKILQDTKTMSGCMAEIKSKARKQAHSGCAVIEDAQVYKWAVSYFELDVINFPQKQAAPLALDLLDLL